MFRIAMNSPDLLKSTIPIIADIIDEGTFKVDSNGLSLVSPDRSMIAVVDFRLLSSTFDEFNVEGEENLGLNLASFVSVLKRAKSSDKIILEKNEGANALTIRMEGKGKRKFEIPLIDVNIEKPPVDQLQFKATIELDSGILEDGIADADIVDDSIVFEANNESFKLWAKGDISSMELELRKGDEGLHKLDTSEAIRARYPLEYLKKMIKAAKLSERVVIRYSTDYPLRLEFNEKDKVGMSFILAPRVEE